jgi:transcriptional regulator with XRE-family HTH domain
MKRAAIVVAHEECECQLLDALIDRLALKSDAALAARLGLDRTNMYAIRAGRSRLGAAQRIKVLDQISLLHDVNLARLLTAGALLERIRATFTETRIEEPMGTDDSRLLYLWKYRLKATRDHELADSLALSRPTISQIRAGKVGLGIRPRLRILEHLDPSLPYSAIYSALSSTDYLLQQVRQHAAGHMLVVNNTAVDHRFRR